MLIIFPKFLDSVELNYLKKSIRDNNVGNNKVGYIVFIYLFIYLQNNNQAGQQAPCAGTKQMRYRKKVTKMIKNNNIERNNTKEENFRITNRIELLTHSRRIKFEDFKLSA